jgi:hypothetical protein
MAVETTSGFPAIADGAWNDTYAQITVMGWIQPGASGEQDLIMKNRDWDFGIIGTDGVDLRARFFCEYTGGGSSDGEWHSSDDSLQIGVPAHIAAVQDRDADGTGIIYVNGLDDTVEITPAAGNRRSSNNYYRILNNWNGASPIFGIFADLRVYSRLLSAAEIETIATSRGGDNIRDALEVQLMLDEFEPGHALVNGDTEETSEFGRAIDLEAGPVNYVEDPFGLSVLNSRRKAG